MKIEKLKPGMRVYQVGRHKMGNTTMSTVGVWDVLIQEVNVDEGYVTARWNGNAPRRFYESDWSKWRAEEPLLIKSGLAHRLATRAEIAAHRAAKAAP